MAKRTGASILGAVAQVATGGRVKGKYDESKHKRGAGGKFASKGLGPKGPAPKKVSAKSTVYDLADKMKGASKKEVLAAAKAAGVNDSTAANHYHYWQKRQVQLLAAKKLGPDPVAALKKMDDPRAEMKKIVGEALGIKKPVAPAGSDTSLTNNQKLMAKHQKTLDDPNATPEAKKKAANNVKYYANAHKKEMAGKTAPKADPKPEPKPEPKRETKPKLTFVKDDWKTNDKEIMDGLEPQTLVIKPGGKEALYKDAKGKLHTGYQLNGQNLKLSGYSTTSQATTFEVKDGKLIDVKTGKEVAGAKIHDYSDQQLVNKEGKPVDSKGKPIKSAEELQAEVKALEKEKAALEKKAEATAPKELSGTEKLIAKHQKTLDDPNASPEAKKKAANNVKYYKNQLAKEGGKPKETQPDNETKASQTPAPDKAQKAADKAQKDAEKAQKAADKAYKAEQKQKIAKYKSTLPYYTQKDFDKKVKAYQKGLIEQAVSGQPSYAVTQFEKNTAYHVEQKKIAPEDVPDFKLPQSEIDDLVAKHKEAVSKHLVKAQGMNEKLLQAQINAKKNAADKLAQTPEQYKLNVQEYEQQHNVNGAHFGKNEFKNLQEARDRAGVTYNHTNSVVNSYTNSGYESINGNLRDGKPAGASAKTLDSLIKNSTFKEETIMWRGVGGGGGEAQIFNNAPPPPELEDLAFTSVSFNPNVARGFSNGKTVFRVRVPEGFPGLNIAIGAPATSNEGLKGEAEVLLPRGTTYRVVKRHLGVGPQLYGSSDRMDIVDLEPVLPPGYPNY